MSGYPDIPEMELCLTSEVEQIIRRREIITRVACLDKRQDPNP